ncbi:MAG TPA: hypothetical protein VHU41_11670 [Thermoanaerobaculia bacterium]|nr:hypothetical protein [Thermoanaerobaculia bacterium]
MTAPVLGRAPFSQNGIRIASSGSVTLAAWVDGRTRSADVIATRVDITGKPLDPTGIVIRKNADLEDVFWDDTDFVVITSAANTDHELVFVGVDGVIRRRISLPVTLRYAARTDQGADSRLLFLPHDGYSPLATIVDLDGNILRRGAEDTGGTAMWAASNGTGFLVIRHATAFLAEAMDRDGNVLTSVDTHLPPDFSPTAMSGDGHGGYVLVGYLPALGDRTLFHLDATGVEQGAPVVLQTRDVIDPGEEPIGSKMTAGGFVVTWTVVLQQTSSTLVSVDGGPPVQVSSVNGSVHDAAYDPDTDLVFTAMRDLTTWGDYDVWVQKGTAPRQPLTVAAADQSGAHIAAGANGFLAAWSESTPDGRLAFARRFSVDGTPLDDPKIFSDTIVNYVPTVTSSGDVYLVTDGGSARRMDARTGEWLDATPFLLRDRAIASNGKDALALTLEDCGGSIGACIAARRVAMNGEPLLFNPVLLPMYSDSQPLLASDGKDFLVVWAERNCGFGCPSYYSRIVVMRLGADGSFIDRAPIVLTGYSGYIGSPSVSWNGTTYLVTWQDRGMSGAFISSDGNVQQLGTISDRTFAAAAGSNFLLFRRLVSDAGDEWDGKVLGDSEWTPIMTRPNLRFGPPSIAANGGYVMLAYDRIADDAGRVGRVFLDPRAFVSRRRAVH